MWMDRFRGELNLGMAQFHQYASNAGWRAGLTRKSHPRQATTGDATPAGWNDKLEAVATISDLIQTYKASSWFQDVSSMTKKSYGLYLDRIVEKFGTLSIKVLDERGFRAVIRQWRDNELADQPRTADAMIGVFRRLLNFALDQEYIGRNALAAFGRLHTKSRRDVIWSDAQIAAFLAKAPRHLARVLLLALWTGQRQGDLLALKWDAYDGQYIRLEQRKTRKGATGRRVKILVSGELRRVLAEIEAEQIARSQHSNPRRRAARPDLILTTSTGRPWRHGFRCAWRKAVDNAGIEGVTFHDLRGTFITLSHQAGATIREIAEASGHYEEECERVIRQHYLATGAERVISKLEASRRFATDHWAAQAAHNSNLDTQERFTGPRYPRLLVARK